MSSQPTRHSVDNRGLKLNVWSWGSSSTSVVLHHGFLDHSRSWDPLAERLQGQYRVLAVDGRGHGDSDWIGAGGYYYFQDYVSDLSRVIDELTEGPVILVGHSMGGMVVSLFCGAFASRVRAMVSIEGFGPPGGAPEDAPERMAGWVRAVEAKTDAEGRLLADIDAGAARLMRRNPRLDRDFAVHLATHGTKETEDGRRWKWDPMHLTVGPQPFYLAQAQAFWRRVKCPALLISGGESLFRYPEGHGRECIPGADSDTIAEAGHMVHYEQPEALAERLAQFIDGGVSP